MLTTDLPARVATAAARYVKDLFHCARRNRCPAAFRSGTQPNTASAAAAAARPAARAAVCIDYACSLRRGDCPGADRDGTT